MKLKVAVLHKEQQVKTRNYKVWITKHTVHVEKGMFSVKKLHMSYFAPRPEQDVLLFDHKYVLYADHSITPLDRNWNSPELPPGFLLAALDDRLLTAFTHELYSFKDCLVHMFKSWLYKLTFRKEKTCSAKNAEDSFCKSNEADVEEEAQLSNVNPVNNPTNK